MSEKGRGIRLEHSGARLRAVGVDLVAGVTGVFGELGVGEFHQLGSGERVLPTRHPI